MKHENLHRLGLGGVFMVLCLGALLLSVNPISAAQAESPSKLTLIESTPNRVILELELSRYESREQTVDGVTYAVLSVPGLTFTGDVGKPQLPTKGAMIGIPSGAKASLRILQDESHRDNLAIKPLPVPGMRALFKPPRFSTASPDLVFAPDKVTYSADRPYPSDVVRVGSTEKWRSQTVLLVEFHPLQYDPAARQVLFHKRLRVEITLSYPAGWQSNAVGRTVNEGRFEDVLQGALLNYETAKNWRARITSPRASARNLTAYSVGSWYKIPVDTDGIYQIPCNHLPAGLDPNTLRVFKHGSEMAINVVGNIWSTCDPDSDYLEFFGQAPKSKYSTANTYWLTFGPRPDLGPVKRMSVRTGGSHAGVAATFSDTIHLEQDIFYAPYTPRVEGYDHWFWGVLPGGTHGDYVFTLDRLAAGAFSAALTVDLAGFSEPGWGSGDHHTLTYVNGTLVDESYWNGNVARNATFLLAPSVLRNGSNTVRIHELSGGYDYAFVDKLGVSYASIFSTTNNMLRFRQSNPGAWQYRIAGFTDATVGVFDVTNPMSVTQIVTTTMDPPFTLVFNDTITEPHEYLALAATQRRIVSSLALDTPSNLRALTNAADYVIISPSTFHSSIQPLVVYRASQGYRVKLIDLQDVYDEFNDGVADPQAIRDLLEYALANWQSPGPSYVLLVGDGTYDPKYNCIVPGRCIDYTVTPPGSTILPPYLRMVDPIMGEAPSDTRLVAFGDATGNTLPNMAIGRLPANSPADVTAMVNKILAYEQNPPAPDWRGRLTFVADSPYDANGNYYPEAGNFWLLSDEIASDPRYVPPPSYAANRVYYNPCDPILHPQCGYTSYYPQPNTRDGLFSAFQNGSLFISYIGHGGVTGWSNDSIFLASDVGGLSNSGRLPVMLEMTCSTGNFARARTDEASLAETTVRAPGKGSVASWAPTGLGRAIGHSVLQKGFLYGVMWQGKHQLGPAIIAGYANVYASGGYLDLIDTYLLLGDPATRLNIQPLPRSYLPLISR